MWRGHEKDGAWDSISCWLCLPHYLRPGITLAVGCVCRFICDLETHKLFVVFAALSATWNPISCRLCLQPLRPGITLAVCCVCRIICDLESYLLLVMFAASATWNPLLQRTSCLTVLLNVWLTTAYTTKFKDEFKVRNKLATVVNLLDLSALDALI